MAFFLDEIVANKKKEVESRKELYPVKLLEKSIYFESPTVSLAKYLQRKDLSGIIAEIKRKSPSKGVINQNISIEQLSIGYMQAGASALSVLTDEKFFGGKNEDLTAARKFNFCPILRKDFIIDEYQILEARSIGADVVLLIARILDAQQVRAFSSLAKRLGLEVLLEIHNESEIRDRLNPEISIVGVNNRDLDTLSINIETSLKLADKLPKEMIRISESGLDSAATIRKLKQAGYHGFLIGESFMKTSSPDIACSKLVNELAR